MCEGPGEGLDGKVYQGYIIIVGPLEGSGGRIWGLLNGHEGSERELWAREGIWRAVQKSG